MKSLSDFVKEKSQFVSLDEEGSFSGVYKGYKFIEKEVRGETKEYARYLLQDLEDKQVRNLDSQSIGLAKKMDKVPIGSVIKITRTGEGFDTKYEVEFEELKNKVAVEEDENEEPTLEIDEKDIPVIEDENA